MLTTRERIHLNHLAGVRRPSRHRISSQARLVRRKALFISGKLIKSHFVQHNLVKQVAACFSLYLQPPNPLAGPISASRIQGQGGGGG